MSATALLYREPLIEGDYLFLTENQKYNSVYSSDPDIVNAIRRGDEQAFEHTFRHYYQRLCNYACTLLKDEEESEEVVQTVFLTIWEKREDLEITLSLKNILLGVGISGVVGVLAGFIPARSASNLDPVVAIRSN